MKSSFFILTSAFCILLFRQSLAHKCGSDPCDANDFIPPAQAGRNGNGRSRHLQKFREKFDASVIGAAFQGRRGQRELQRVAQFAGDGILLRPRMHLHRERNSVIALFDGKHGSETSTLTEVAALSVAETTLFSPRSHRVTEKLIDMFFVSVSLWIRGDRDSRSAVIATPELTADS